MSTKRLLMVSALAALAFSSTSCTLTKPFVCAVSTPIYVLGIAATLPAGLDPEVLRAELTSLAKLTGVECSLSLDADEVM